jgi:hypothetical protein
LGSGNDVFVGQDPNGSLKVDFRLTSSALPAGVGPAIDGIVVFHLDADTGSIGVVVSRDTYPSFESYLYLDGTVVPLLLQDEPHLGPFSAFGLFPIEHISEWHVPR